MPWRDCISGPSGRKQRIMRPNDETASALARGVPFSLVCLFCDAGQGVSEYSKAIGLGWHDVEVATDLIQANYYGVCPECVKTRGCICCSPRCGPARPETVDRVIAGPDTDSAGATL